MSALPRLPTPEQLGYQNPPDTSALEKVKLASRAYQGEVDRCDEAKEAAVNAVLFAHAEGIATAASVYYEAMAVAHREGFRREDIASYLHSEPVAGHTPS